MYLLVSCRVVPGTRGGPFVKLTQECSSFVTPLRTGPRDLGIHYSEIVWDEFFRPEWVKHPSCVVRFTAAIRFLVKNVCIGRDKFRGLRFLCLINIFCVFSHLLLFLIFLKFEPLRTRDCFERLSKLNTSSVQEVKNTLS